MLIPGVLTSISELPLMHNGVIFLRCDRVQLLQAWSDQQQSSTRTPGRRTVGSGGSAAGPHPTGRGSAPVWAPELQREPGWGGTTRAALRTQSAHTLTCRLHPLPPRRVKQWYTPTVHYLVWRYVFIQWDNARSLVAALAPRRASYGQQEATHLRAPRDVSFTGSKTKINP